MSSDGAVKVHKFPDGGKVHSVRNKTFKGKPRLVKPVCGGAQMKYSVKHPVKKKEKDQTNNKKKKSIQRYQTSSPVVILSPLLQLMCYLICRRERVTGSRMFLAPDHHDNSHNKFSLFTYFCYHVSLSLFFFSFFFIFFHSNILMSTRRCCIIIWHLCNE